MTKKKLTSKERATMMNQLGYKFIAGKWFLNDDEIDRVDASLYREEALACSEPGDAENAMAVFRAMYGDFRGEWPTMPIIAEALKMEALKPLAFPLTEKQLAIIFQLLSGKEEMIYICTGVGGSGKSTFANIVKQIFSNDFAPLTIGDLSDDFKLARGVGKRLIYADELDVNDMRSNIIKTLASKQDVTINPKYGRTYSVRWQGNLFFSCNKPPKMDISDSGLLRRICYFSMNKKIAKPDQSLQKKEFSHEELVNIVAHAIRIDNRNWFEKWFREDTHKVIMSGNSVALCPARTYEDYVFSCNDKGYKRYSEDNWRAIKELFEEWKQTPKASDPNEEETEW